MHKNCLRSIAEAIFYKHVPMFLNLSYLKIENKAVYDRLSAQLPLKQIVSQKITTKPFTKA